jgi:hypothetical protein
MLGAVFEIEPQRRHLRRWSMALEAFVREDRADVPIEFDGRRKRLQRSRGNRGRPLRRRLRDMHQDRAGQRECTQPS